MPGDSKRERLQRRGGLLCGFHTVALVPWSKACVQGRSKGSVEAFDVGFFCVQASWLLMRQPASLSELHEAPTQPHGGTASCHCSEATNCSSLAPHWDQRPAQPPFSNGTHGTQNCTYTWVWPKTRFMGESFVSPVRRKLWDVRREFGDVVPIDCAEIWSELWLERRQFFFFFFQHSLCCDLSLILFGSHLPAQLAGNKGFSPVMPRLCPNFNVTWGGRFKNSTAQWGWKHHHQNQINMLHTVLNSD